jgi:hypothetical protein
MWNIKHTTKVKFDVLDGKHEGRRQVGTPRRKWEDNIRLDLREITWARCILLRIGIV